MLLAYYFIYSGRGFESNVNAFRAGCQRYVRELQGGYSSTHRVIEIVATVVFYVFFLYSLYALVPVLKFAHVIPTLIGMVLSLFLADFISGLVHWGADTWGSSRWPVLGPALLRPFREHHVDPLSITRHDFIERNGDNALLCIPLLVLLYFIPAQGMLLSVKISVLTLALSLALTNQIHCWAHQKTRPRFVTAIKNAGVILSPRVHKKHHEKKYDKNYCITTGRMYVFLEKIAFFRVSERVISKLTGAIPRQDESWLWQK